MTVRTVPKGRQSVAWGLSPRKARAQWVLQPRRGDTYAATDLCVAWRAGRVSPPVMWGDSCAATDLGFAPSGLTTMAGCPRPWGLRPRLHSAAAARLNARAARDLTRNVSHEGCRSVACNVAFRSAKELPFAERKATDRCHPVGVNGMRYGREPRALPWAVEFDPLGVGHGEAASLVTDQPPKKPASLVSDQRPRSLSPATIAPTGDGAHAARCVIRPNVMGAGRRIAPSSPNGARFHSEGRNPANNGAPNQPQAPTGRNPPLKSPRRGRGVALVVLHAFCSDPSPACLAGEAVFQASHAPCNPLRLPRGLASRRLRRREAGPRGRGVEIGNMERSLSHPNFPLLPDKLARGR